jgi:hypothetical protein
LRTVAAGAGGDDERSAGRRASIPAFRRPESPISARLSIAIDKK